MRRSRIVAVNGIPRPGTTGVRIRLAEAAVAAVRLLMLTGCRRDEILTLRRVRRRIARVFVRWPRGADSGRTAA